MVHVIADLFAGMPDEKPANSDPLMAPHGVYPCAGDDEWCAIAVEDDAANAENGTMGKETTHVLPGPDAESRYSPITLTMTRSLVIGLS